MKLTGRNITVTVIAAIVTVLTYRMLSSLATDAIALLVGLAVAGFFTVPIGVLAYSAGKRSDSRADDDDDRSEHDRDLAAYWQANGEVIRRQMELRAAYEQGRDHAREDAGRQRAALNVWLVDEPANTAITRQ